MKKDPSTDTLRGRDKYKRRLRGGTTETKKETKGPTTSACNKCYVGIKGMMDDAKLSLSV